MIVDKRGRSCLWWATRFGHKACVKFLGSMGGTALASIANPASSPPNKTPIEVARPYMRRILANSAFKFYQVSEGKKRRRAPPASLVLDRTSYEPQYCEWQKKRKNKDKRVIQDEMSVLTADEDHEVLSDPDN